MRRLGTLLISLGALLIAYTVWSYGQFWWSQRAIQQQMAAELERQAQAAAAPPAAPAPPRSLKPGQPLFELEIPKINLYNIVVEGSDDASLQKGPGHVENTALPGEAGNVAVAAHRDYYFWRLGELKPGDEVFVKQGGERLKYRVTGSRVAHESEVSVLDPTPQPTMTLITCWPLIYAGETPERLIVTAELAK